LLFGKAGAVQTSSGWQIMIAADDFKPNRSINLTRMFADN